MRALLVLALVSVACGGPLTDDDLDALAADEADLGNSVVVNEWSTGAAGWIELYNPTSSTKDLSGWSVDDTTGGSAPKKLAAGTKLAAKARLVVPYAGLNVASADEVRLLDASGVVVDSQKNGYTSASTAGKCYGRAPDGADVAAGPLSACTKGAANPAPVAPPSASCAAGTFGGVAFTRAEACKAVDFLNKSSFTGLGLGSVGNRVAYDCGPSGQCGVRTSSWKSLSELAAFDRGGKCQFGPFNALKLASQAWDGRAAHDTVANVWTNRTTLDGRDVTFDRVYVSRAIPAGNSETNGCAEVRDSPNSSVFITICDKVNRFADDWGQDFTPFVGKYLWVRGQVRYERFTPVGPRWVVGERATPAAERCGKLSFFDVVP